MTREDRHGPDGSEWSEDEERQSLEAFGAMAGSPDRLEARLALRALVKDAADAIFTALESSKDESLKAMMVAVGLGHMNGAVLRDADLSGQDLSGISFVGADFSGADLSGCDLRGCDMTSAIFDGTRLRGTRFDFVPVDLGLMDAADSAADWRGPVGSGGFGLYLGSILSGRGLSLRRRVDPGAVTPPGEGEASRRATEYRVDSAKS